MVLFLLQAAGVGAITETSPRASGIRRALRPSTVTRTAQEFGITVIALAAITAVGTILSARRATRQRCLSPSLAK